MADGPNPTSILEDLMHSREQCYLRDLPDPTDAILGDWAAELADDLLHDSAEAWAEDPMAPLAKLFERRILAAVRELIDA